MIREDHDFFFLKTRHTTYCTSLYLIDVTQDVSEGNTWDVTDYFKRHCIKTKILDLHNLHCNTYANCFREDKQSTVSLGHL